MTRLLGWVDGLKLYNWQVDSHLAPSDKPAFMPTKYYHEILHKYNMAAVLIVPANTVTGRWISVVRIAPTVALLKYRPDVGNFKNNPQRHLSCQAALKPVRGENARPCPTRQYIAEKNMSA